MRAQSLHPIIVEARKQFLYVDSLRNSFHKKVPRRTILENIETAMQRRRMLLKSVKKVCLTDLVPEDTVKGLGGVLLALGFIRRKREFILCSTRVKRSLRRAMRFLERGKIRRSDKWLSRAALYARKGLMILERIKIRLDTALYTAQTVQIQIQKGRKKM